MRRSRSWARGHETPSYVQRGKFGSLTTKLQSICLKVLATREQTHHAHDCICRVNATHPSATHHSCQVPASPLSDMQDMTSASIHVSILHQRLRYTCLCYPQKNWPVFLSVNDKKSNDDAKVIARTALCLGTTTSPRFSG